jgi:tRNA uridine 5-carbamoylmethylation protein Kti12
MELKNMNIILIGPRGVGKSCVAKILSEKLNKNIVSLDSVRRLKSQDPIFQNGQLDPFSEDGHANIVKRVILEYGNKDCILDFGCNHSYFNNQSLFSEIKDILSPFQNIFLLIPTNNFTENINILQGMNAKMLEGESLSYTNAINEKILKSPCNFLLAKETVFTKDFDFEEIADEIIRKIQ